MPAKIIIFSKTTTFPMKNIKPPQSRGATADFPLKGGRGIRQGEVRKDGNPCKTATQNPAATV